MERVLELYSFTIFSVLDKYLQCKVREYIYMFMDMYIHALRYTHIYVYIHNIYIHNICIYTYYVYIYEIRYLRLQIHSLLIEILLSNKGIGAL